MIRLVRMSGTWYGITIETEYDLEDDAENIHVLVEAGDPVILVDDLEQVEELGICVDEVVMTQMAR